MNFEIGTSAGAEGATYRAPISDIVLALDVAGLDDLLRLEFFKHVDRESVIHALTEFGKLASNVICPSDRVGDVTGAHFYPTTGVVKTPIEFRRSYAQYVQGGWGALPFPTEFGGGGLPSVIGLAIQEMFASANLALSLNPVLTQSAIGALLDWGNQEQQSLYLPRLLTGEWTGTMNMTEPDAGSDLALIRTRGELVDDGQWRITGTKTFITWGEHDLAENIIHFVLARTSNVTPGTRGLSLFMVPKYLLDDRGEPGKRNDLRCARIEGKLGIHGSPTCEMEYNGAVGELVGPLHGGMRAMFTMMNVARLSIGAQGPAVAERAFQHARQYASARLQGHASGSDHPGPSPIIDHLDVRRMLLMMTTTTQASRSLLYLARAHSDRARNAPDEHEREKSQQMADLLTPVAKAWSTDSGLEATSLGVQVLGGIGYIEETGMAQRLRDARILPIYEGTNGVQALDLVTRKLPRDGGKWVHALFRDISNAIPEPVPVDDPLTETYEALASALGTLATMTNRMIDRMMSEPREAVAGATTYLELFGITVGAWLMQQRAHIAMSSNSPEKWRIIGESNFFAIEVARRVPGLIGPLLASAAHLDVPIGAGG